MTLKNHAMCYDPRKAHTEHIFKVMLHRVLFIMIINSECYL